MRKALPNLFLTLGFLIAMAVVAKAQYMTPDVDLSSSVNPSSLGQDVTFTASLDVQGCTGTVNFYDGGNQIGYNYVNNNSASIDTTSLSGGTHSITASYNGDSMCFPNTSGTLNQVVNGATPTVTLSSTPNPANVGQTVTFTASLSITTCTGTVTFLDSGSGIGTGNVSNGSATLQTSSLAAGSHSMTASYGGDSICSSAVSSALNQVINSSSGGPTISTLSPTQGAPLTQFSVAGSGFGNSRGSSTVSVGSVSNASVVSWSASSITVVVPVMSSGTFAVTVTVNGTASNSSYFTVTGSSGSCQ